MPGRVKYGGTEGKIVVAHGRRKRKKLICGTEGEIVVAHGRLPSPALHSGKTIIITQKVFNVDQLKIIIFEDFYGCIIGMYDKIECNVETHILLQ